MKLGNNIEVYNDIINQMNKELCLPKIFKKLDQISFIKRDIKNIQSNLQKVRLSLLSENSSVIEDDSNGSCIVATNNLNRRNEIGEKMNMYIHVDKT